MTKSTTQLALPAMDILSVPGIDWEDGRLAIKIALPFQHWASITEATARMARNNGWWLGDAWNYGEQYYGEDVAQIIEPPKNGEKHGTIAGLSELTVRNSAWVCRRFPPDQRTYADTLSFGHHYTVAKLCYERPDLAERLLAQAAREGWKRKQLRATVNALAKGKTIELPSGSVKVVKPEKNGHVPLGEPIKNNTVADINPIAMPAKVVDLTPAEHCQTCECMVNEAEMKAIEREKALVDEFRREYDNYKIYRKTVLGLVEE